MNFNKFINSDYLKSNPLCGISTYKDTLNLSNGSCTRYVKKLVLDGTENWLVESGTNGLFTLPNVIPLIQYNNQLCTHFSLASSYVNFYNTDLTFAVVTRPCVLIHYNACKTVSAFKAFLASEYAAGHPVTIWYVLPTPTTETITVPSGLSGTEEGYLNQSGTPTPTNPIYPTANTVEKWFDINHYIMGTDTDTLTTLPADIYANDTTATVGISGNMSQTGTPTPDNPIMPQSCGERTGNLFYKKISGVNINTQGKIIPNSEFDMVVAKVTEGETYSVSGCSGIMGFYVSEPELGSTSYNNARDAIVSPVTIPQGVNYVAYRVSNRPNVAMLNLGSTALPYEPYGYKIPISSASTTTPIYLGETQSTRRIKKLVFNGTENWQKTTNFLYLSGLSQSATSGCICSHYKGTISGADYTCTMVGNMIRVYDSSYSTAEDFKTYLAAQYANGTPVTVWYVLATPATGIVNEPLMRIGDYADSISGISIPVTAGGDTLSVGTTVQPSEVTVNYKGWHPVSSVHERESGAWT